MNGVVKLSPVMREAVERARVTGGLYRWRGGFWSDHAQTQEQFANTNTPTWWVGAQTVRALERRGLVERLDWKAVRITPKGELEV
jgi:hypothetical protein